MTANLSTATPVEIDTELYELDRKIPQAQFTADKYARHLNLRIHSSVSTPEEVEQARKLYEEAQDALDDLRERYNWTEGFYTGWNRYWLVMNPGGHVHKTTRCSTCFATTQFSRLPQYSDTPEEDFVQDAGVLACTVCFPNAPVDKPTVIEDPERKAKREAKEAEKAAKDAEKAKKAIYDVDGSELYSWRVKGKDQLVVDRVIKTEVAASRQAMESAFDLRWYGRLHPSAPAWEANVQSMLAALANKRGTTVKTEREALDKKIQAKAKREGLI